MSENDKDFADLMADFVSSPFRPPTEPQSALTPEGTINPMAVTQMFFDSMFTEEEIAAAKGSIPEGAVRVSAINTDYGFHKARLESHREDVRTMLELLPENFAMAKGGGWSFLYMCEDINGRQWTSFHVVMEQLLSLAIGLNLMVIVAPREMWRVLPGGMPYVATTL